jgi:uncharacterized SAM-binding protein YcdF (DUF218 family)
MNLSWLITNGIAALMLPPMLMVLMALLGFVLLRSHKWLGRSFIVLAFLLLVVLSTSAGSRWLIRPLEAKSLPLLSVQKSQAQAIVILGGGRLYSAPDDGGRDLPNAQTLLRLRRAAQIQRLTNLPILVSGGSPEIATLSEAELMARSLQEDFRVPVKWVEGRSDNTAQNAQRSAELLKAAGINRIFLVTDAMHMPRAKNIFLSTGLIVIPAPTGFHAQNALQPHDFLPTAGALKDSHYAMHEWLGLLWYRIRHGSSW